MAILEDTGAPLRAKMGVTPRPSRSNSVVSAGASPLEELADLLPKGMTIADLFREFGKIRAAGARLARGDAPVPARVLITTARDAVRVASAKTKPWCKPILTWYEGRMKTEAGRSDASWTLVCDRVADYLVAADVAATLTVSDPAEGALFEQSRWPVWGFDGVNYVGANDMPSGVSALSLAPDRGASATPLSVRGKHVARRAARVAAAAAFVIDDRWAMPTTAAAAVAVSTEDGAGPAAGESDSDAGGAAGSPALTGEDGEDDSSSADDGSDTEDVADKRALLATVFRQETYTEYERRRALPRLPYM